MDTRVQGLEQNLRILFIFTKCYFLNVRESENRSDALGTFTILCSVVKNKSSQSGRHLNLTYKDSYVSTM